MGTCWGKKYARGAAGGGPGRGAAVGGEGGRGAGAVEDPRAGRCPTAGAFPPLCACWRHHETRNQSDGVRAVGTWCRR